MIRQQTGAFLPQESRITVSILQSERQTVILFLCRVLSPSSVPLLQALRRWIEPDSHAPPSNAAIDLTFSKAELVFENAFPSQQMLVLIGR